MKFSDFVDLIKVNNEKGYRYYYRFREDIIKYNITSFKDNMISLGNIDVCVGVFTEVIELKDSRQTPFSFEKCYIIRNNNEFKGYVYK